MSEDKYKPWVNEIDPINYHKQSDYSAWALGPLANEVEIKKSIVNHIKEED